jgi:GT2 family glycosyltransferase
VTSIKISIIIVSYNTLGFLKRCIETLEKCHFAFNWEAIIVDNASTDGSTEWLQTTQFGQNYKIVLANQNLGFAKGNNVGISQATGDFVLLLNTDAFPKPGAIENLLSFLLTNSQVAIAGPQLVNEDGSWQRCSGWIISTRTAILHALGVSAVLHTLESLMWFLARGAQPARSVEYVDGASMLIRRKALDAIGPLDESFFFYIEDMELCYRARKQGWQVCLVPQSTVTHLRGGSSSSKNFERALRMRIDSERRFMLRYYTAKDWQRYCRWMAFNSRWRQLLYRLDPKHRDISPMKQQIIYTAYRSASHESGDA